MIDMVGKWEGRIGREQRIRRGADDGVALRVSSSVDVKVGVVKDKVRTVN